MRPLSCLRDFKILQSFLFLNSLKLKDFTTYKIKSFLIPFSFPQSPQLYFLPSSQTHLKSGRSDDKKKTNTTYNSIELNESCNILNKLEPNEENRNNITIGAALLLASSRH